MDKYCCFLCPKGDYSLKSLDDHCPTCGRPYGFPLTDHPIEIGQFNVMRPLGRGFYGSAYVAERKGALKTKRVLKIMPVNMYKFFGKNFEAECASHAGVAEGADHIVGINDTFDADVVFSDLTVRCHVAVLDFIDGEPLRVYLQGDTPLTASEAAQIAADLFRMKAELEVRLSNHNDLHAGNIVIQRLSKGTLRQGAMDPSIRAMAIDLGSLAADRRSGGSYVGDLRWIAHHIQAMVDQLTADIDTTSDLDNRVANALQMIVQSIATNVEYQRTPSADDFIRAIEREYWRTAEPWRPWRDRLELRLFGASYNAQTMEAWHVPQLLVDPDGTWLRRLSAPGPLIVTGMRGCGKTMLLRALQFHARAVKQGRESNSEVIERLQGDNYVGLFVSAYRLLNVAEEPTATTYDLFARLYVAYALESVRALAHLADIAPQKLVHDGHEAIAQAVVDLLKPAIDMPELATAEQLERYLSNLLIRISRSDSDFTLASHPAMAFPHLAQAIRRASTLWQDAQVLYLLDDVSTRYLTMDRVEDILSALIFQNPTCAFKLTSEAQTILLKLKSPGQVDPAAHWRDYETFDLGAEVHGRLKHGGGQAGKKFVEDILQLRGKYFPRHPGQTPSDVLGDISLETIAQTIARTAPESRDRKQVYRGISALTGMCVGDIGSVIRLYEDILGRVRGKYPVPAHVQSEVFQDFCAWHLYLLDRRGSDLKDVAKSFAEAAHELLVQSARSKSNPPRLRQYASIYVRVTTGNFLEQMDRLRVLVDAGIFVFTGGAPRTKTRDSNPVQQFKLTYRKVYGLVNFIGLAERDRFELSGEALEEWLKSPAAGKDILMRNLRTDSESDEEAPPSSDRLEGAAALQRTFELPMPLSTVVVTASGTGDDLADDIIRVSHLPLPEITPIDLTTIASRQTDTLVLGLGFEERTAVSARRLLEAVQPKRILAIRYQEAGRASEILSTIAASCIPVEEVTYSASEEFGSIAGTTVVDVTGLAKPAIFKLIRSVLRSNNDAFFVYTAADGYYPLEADLQQVLEAYQDINHHQLLLALKNVLTGEERPYVPVPLLKSQSDGTRLRGLCAFSSSKHERLLQLIEERDYDQIDVIVNEGTSPRTRIAQIAGEVAIRGSQNATISSCNASNPAAILEVIGRLYESWYVRDGLNFEIGLTGNKMQAVASAVLSAAVHVNQCWYVKPSSFDPERFTTGFGDTKCFHIQMGRSFSSPEE